MYPNNPQKNKKRLNDYARYSGLAFEMIAVILIGTFGGIKLDEKVPLKFPLFTVCLSFLSVCAAIYLAVKDLLKK